MSCAIANGYVMDCTKDSLGGLSDIKIAERKSIASYTEVDGLVTGVTMVTGKQFFKIDLVKSTSNFVITPTGNAQAGTLFFAEVVTLVMNKLKASTSKLVEALAKASVVIIAKDRNGEIFILGRENGLDVTGGTIGSGTAGADRSGYELQFSGEEAKISHVDPTIVEALLIPAV